MKLKKIFVLFFISAILMAPSVYAASSVGSLDWRIGQAKKVLSEIMNSPDQSIPEELLAKCKAIAIFPNAVKGGFIFSARFGKGVVVAKDPQTHEWGPVAFSTLGGGGVGFQVGGQATDLILVVLNKPGLDGLLSSNFTLGANASLAAGPIGRHSEIATDLFLRAGIVSYSRNRGVFAGVAFDGGLLTQDNKSNTAYYGKNVSSRDILLGRAVSIQPSSKELIEALNQYSGRWEKRIGFKP